MSDMIERVARALCRSDGPPEDEPSPMTGEVWWKFYVPQARAAIAAMREPTQPMLDQVCCGHSYSGDERTITWVWEDMIDAALASPVPPKDAG